MLSSYDRREAKMILLTEGKVPAVKFVRKQCHCGLREALDIVETIANGQATPRSSPSPHGMNFEPQSQKKSSLLFTIAGMVFLALSISLMTAVWYVGNQNSEFISRGERTTATVVAMKSRGSSQAPILEYAWEDGTRRHESGISSSPPAYEVGDTAEIYVDPISEDVLVNDFLHRRFAQILLGGFGIGCLVPALVMGFLSRI